jgi:dihydroneopterin aldolase
LFAVAAPARAPGHGRIVASAPARSAAALQFRDSTQVFIMPTRRIILSGLALDARIGILEHERRATQPLHVDAEFDVDIQRAVDDHDIHSVLDYRRLREAIVEECTQAHVNLIETLVEQVAARLLADFHEIRSLRLRISKPMAFSDCAAVGVEIQISR